MDPDVNNYILTLKEKDIDNFTDLKSKILRCNLNTTMAKTSASDADLATIKLSKSILSGSKDRHINTINRSNAISQSAELACNSDFKKFYDAFKTANSHSRLSIIDFVKSLNDILNNNTALGGRQRMRRKTSRKRHGKRSRSRSRRYRRKSRKHYR
jgi:hypothetical protein